jgi:hypothetical protein
MGMKNLIGIDQLNVDTVRPGFRGGVGLFLGFYQIRTVGCTQFRDNQDILGAKFAVFQAKFGIHPPIIPRYGDLVNGPSELPRLST